MTHVQVRKPKADPIAIIAGHGLHEGLHGLGPLLLGRAAYLLHDSRRQAVPVALAGVPRAGHRQGAPARLQRLRRLQPSLCVTYSINRPYYLNNNNNTNNNVINNHHNYDHHHDNNSSNINNNTTNINYLFYTCASRC